MVSRLRTHPHARGVAFVAMASKTAIERSKSPWRRPNELPKCPCYERIMHSTAHARTYPRSRPAPLLLLREHLTTDDEPDAHPHPPSTSGGDPEATNDWMGVHAHLASLGRVRAAHEREVCRWLLAAQRLGVHRRVGYASLGELAERMLGLNGRSTEERVRVGRALADLPCIDAAFARGELSWCAVREVTRVATAATEQAWLEWAKLRRVREIEAAVAARKPGDGPRDPSDPSRVAHRLSFEVHAETMALFRELQSRVRDELGGRVDDDMLLHEIALRALDGKAETGATPYQVTVSRCDECARSRIDAGGGSFVVDQAVADMADCDGVVLGGPCSNGDDSHVHGAVAFSPDPRAMRPAASPDGPHVGPRPSRPPRRSRPVTHPGRPKRRVPTPIRRAVMLRDHQRCITPGCSNPRRLQVHHLDPRAEGGGHDPERLAVLCGTHHRAVHRGVICVDGTASHGFVFWHGDGTPYGGKPDIARLDAARQATAALEHMGFKATQARALVDQALRAGAASDMAVLVRAALRSS